MFENIRLILLFVVNIVKESIMYINSIIWENDNLYFR